MGSSHSKRSNRFRKDDKNNEVKILSDNKTENSETEVINEALLDKQYTEDIKKDLCENPEMFVLNNLLMAIMFFKNYPRDVMEIAQKRNNLKDTCYYPDDLIEKVNENVLYRAKHGENKFISEPLIPKRVFVVNRSIKVLAPMEDIERLATNLVRAEESQKKGYLRLKEIVPTFTPDGSPTLSVEGESTASSSRTSSNEDYATFEEMRKSIHDVFAAINTQDILPKMCIEHRRRKKLDLPQDIKVEEITEEDLYEVHSYISSRGFMRHFHQNLFPSFGRDTLQLAEQQILTGKPRIGKIKCKYRDEEFSQTWDIIPAIPIKWPGEQTLEFIMKSQRSPGPRTQFLFPNPTMVGEIMKLGALLIPRGCYSKDRHRKDRDIEWEICFPQAEKYLEKFMTHSQMKSYLILLCLYKTYIAPITFEKGLLTEHLQSFILAQLDKNFKEWPEHKLGTKLFKLLKQLNFLIGNSDLKDYFITEKKPLDNISKKYLRENQRVLHDVIESPLMGFLKSLRNLQYVKGGQSFYTPIDFDKLYSILQQKGLQLTVPNLPVVSSPRRKIPLENLDSSTIWIHVNENVKREKKRRQKELEKQRELEEALARRQSEDSIDLTWTCEKEFDLHKKRALLKYFIDIFLEISNKCTKYLWYKQGLLYLKQTKYLTEILKEECAAFGDEVQEIMEKINQEELEIADLSKRTHQDCLEENSQTRTQNGPLVNGSIPSLRKAVKLKPHVEIGEKILNNVKKVELLSPKTTKNRRKTVAFNFDDIPTN